MKQIQTYSALSLGGSYLLKKNLCYNLVLRVSDFQRNVNLCLNWCFTFNSSTLFFLDEAKRDVSLLL